MIHSIYTHKEIFLRELISNASDAIDKLYFKSLTDDSVGMNKSDFKITLAVDKDARTLTITDNGIGMTKEEIEAILEPKNFVGRAPEQTEEFITEVVKPVLDANKDILGMTAEINV